jgi:hypothetical protein
LGYWFAYLRAQQTAPASAMAAPQELNARADSARLSV